MPLMSVWAFILLFFCSRGMILLSLKAALIKSYESISDFLAYI